MNERSHDPDPKTYLSSGCKGAATYASLYSEYNESVNFVVLNVHYDYVVFVAGLRQLI
jgi:hypothetical protein